MVLDYPGTAVPVPGYIPYACHPPVPPSATKYYEAARSSARPGSHVAVERSAAAGLYSHHAIYVGDLRGRGNEVIEFCDGHNNEDTNPLLSGVTVKH